MRCGPHAFVPTAPHSRGVNAHRSLTDMKPTLREVCILLSHPPTSWGRPRNGQAGGREASLLALLTVSPRRGLSQQRILGQARLSRARLTAKDRGLM